MRRQRLLITTSFMQGADGRSRCASARSSDDHARPSASQPGEVRLMQVTLIQTASGHDKRRNLADAERKIRGAIEETRPDLIVLPELFTYLGGTAEGAFAAAEAIP